MQNGNRGYKLPTLADLQADPERAFADDSLNFILNQDPPAHFVKEHPTIKIKNELGARVPLKYLPVAIVEYLMTMIFKRWEVANIKVHQLFNSVCVTLTVRYMLPSGDWASTDGVGAMAAQTDAGAAASDMGALKHDAVMKAAPGAESYAFKDACEKLGKIFGRDLSRSAYMQFEAFEPKLPDTAQNKPIQPPATQQAPTAVPAITGQPSQPLPQQQPFQAPPPQFTQPAPQFAQPAPGFPPGHAATKPGSTWNEDDPAPQAYPHRNPVPPAQQPPAQQMPPLKF